MLRTAFIATLTIDTVIMPQGEILESGRGSASPDAKDVARLAPGETHQAREITVIGSTKIRKVGATQFPY